MEITGKLKQLHPIVEKGTFKSRKVWVTTEDNPQYPQTIEVELQQAKVDMMNGVTVGAPVKLHINLRGREWTGTDNIPKVFNSLVCWKVEAAGATAAPVAQREGFEAPVIEDSSELPF